MAERRGRNGERLWDPEMREAVAQQLEALVDAHGGTTEVVRMGIAQRKQASDIPTKHTDGGEPILARVYVERDRRSEYVPRKATRGQRIANFLLGNSLTEKVTTVEKPSAMGIDFYVGEEPSWRDGHPMLHWHITELDDTKVEGIGRAVANIPRPVVDTVQDSVES